MDFLQLHTGLKKEKRKAQQLLFERYGKSMYGVCRRYLKLPEDAEEALMSGFLQVYRNISNTALPQESALTAWMRRIMINECLQKIRKSHSFLTVSEETEIPEEQTASNAETAIGAKELFALIEQLPAGYRTIFNLYVIEGFTHKEIGDLCQITEGASKSQLSKARQKLTQLFNRQNEYYGLGKAR